MLVHEKSRSLLLRARNPVLLQEVFPDRHKMIDYNGHNIAIRHGGDEVKMLNNRGISAPSPILHYYDWPGKYEPWSHQKVTAAMLTMNTRMHVLNEAGTAKTASALWAADYLMSVGKVKKCLITAKLSTLEKVWMEEVFNVLMHRKGVLLYGSRSKRLDLLESDADFYIINHEGIGVVVEELRRRADINLHILDEASDYRNATTSKYKLFESILRADSRVWPMTATPCPNAPTDAWALARLVDKAKVPKYFGAFKRMTMTQITPFKWVAKEGSTKIAFDALQPAVRFIKSECLDLPPVVTTSRACEPTSEQKKLFKEMHRDLVAQAQTGEKITAVNAADKINKIRQLLCGSIKNTDTGVYVDVDYSSRLELLLECIQEASAKAIVVVPFKGIIARLAKDVEKHHTCAVLNGDVPAKKRGEIISQFKAFKDPHVLLCHPKVMAHGLNLTEADMLIFYAPIYSNDEAMQVVERFNRAGQTRKMTVIRMGSHPIEWQIYKMLDTKQDGQAGILDLYKSLIA